MERKKGGFIIKRYKLEHLVPFVITIISVYFWFNYFDQTLLKSIGLVINIIGLFIWWSAKITIGENWSAGYKEPRLKKFVTNGIYSKICHPLYWGINLTLIGLAFEYQKTWFIIIVLLTVLYFFWRMKIENEYLIKKLGKKYEEYKKKIWF